MAKVICALLPDYEKGKAKCLQGHEIIRKLMLCMEEDID